MIDTITHTTLNHLRKQIPCRTRRGSHWHHCQNRLQTLCLLEPYWHEFRTATYTTPFSYAYVHTHRLYQKFGQCLGKSNHIAHLIFTTDKLITCTHTPHLHIFHYADPAYPENLINTIKEHATQRTNHKA